MAKRNQLSQQGKQDLEKTSGHFPPIASPTGSLWPCRAKPLNQHHCWVKDRDRWKIISLKYHAELWHLVNWPSIYNGRQPLAKTKGELNIAWQSLREMIG